MFQRQITISIIGGNDLHDTLLDQVLNQNEDIIVLEKHADAQKFLSAGRLGKVPHVFIIIEQLHPKTQKIMDELKRYHPEVPIMILGDDDREEFKRVNQNIFAYLTPAQIKSYPSAIRIVAEKQHFTSNEYWVKHDQIMSLQQHSKALDKMNQLTLELMNVAKAIAQNPDATNDDLAEILGISHDRVHYKCKKLWQTLGLTCKKDLTAFLVEYFSRNG
jgi:DNA-binding NarL/FixJ family response regulator